jgi:23S rRNA pseudouridine1911/1915/1917 synthase
MCQPIEIAIPEDTAANRADKVLAALLPALSRAQIQRLIEEGRATLASGAKVGRRQILEAGARVFLEIPPPPPAALPPADIALDVLFEDEHLLAVNKPAGMIAHPGAGTGGDTLAHAALAHTGGALAAAAGAARPGIVHRLDKETSGVIVLAKNDAAYHALTRQFSERETDKHYVALVAPCPELLSGSAREAIGRHKTNRVKMAVREDGKPSRTDWRVEERFGKTAARLRCKILTGRTHQIRVHLANCGFPILGDATYGRAGRVPAGALAEAPISRVMLHAERIALTHPASGEKIEITAPLPQDFREAQLWLIEKFGSRPVTRLM